MTIYKQSSMETETPASPGQSGQTSGDDSKNHRFFYTIIALLIVALVIMIIMYTQVEQGPKCPDKMDMNYLQGAVLEISMGDHSDDEKKEKFAGLMYCIIRDALKEVDIHDEQSVNVAFAGMGLSNAGHQCPPCVCPGCPGPNSPNSNGPYISVVWWDDPNLTTEQRAEVYALRELGLLEDAPDPRSDYDAYQQFLEDNGIVNQL